MNKKSIPFIPTPPPRAYFISLNFLIPPPPPPVYQDTPPPPTPVYSGPKSIRKTAKEMQSLKRGTHLGFNAIKMVKKISLALLTQSGNITLKMLKHFNRF